MRIFGDKKNVKVKIFFIFLFFGPCIFNDEEEINQQNAQINF